MAMRGHSHWQLIRRYSALPAPRPPGGRPPGPLPRTAMARLAAAGIRLRDDGRDLIARVPRDLAASKAWPALDRLLTRHAVALADAAALVQEVRRRFPPADVVAHLRGIEPPLRSLVVEVVGGRARLEALLAGQPRGAELDLACFALAEAHNVEWLLRQAGADDADIDPRSTVRRQEGTMAKTKRIQAVPASPPTSLRPERIQQQVRAEAQDGEPALRPERIQERLAADEVDRRLAEMPDWVLARGARAIERTLQFPAFGMLIVALNLVTSLAELSGDYPEIRIRDTRLTLRLTSPKAGGLTTNQFEFARTLDGLAELGRAR